MNIVRIKTDSLIIGGGLAGLSAALELREQGRDVLIVSKGKVGRSGNTIMTKNTIAAVLEEGPEMGTCQEHVKDTLAGGANINNKKLVNLLALEAGKAMQKLEDWGVPFLREKSGHIAIKGSPGHSRKRLISVDASHLRTTYTAGLAVSMPLFEKAKEIGVKFQNGILVASLLQKDGQVCGACGLDKTTSQIWVIEARVVILASGGVGQLYPLTTNAGDVSGDGYALGYLAGAKLCDMEFIQFHPTVAMGPNKEVLSTAPFSDGAVLRNSLGEAFMARYSPQKDMATRDVVARAIYMEVEGGRGSARGGVFEDFSPVPQAKMEREYAAINKRLKDKKIIEVGSAVHFMMGGIVIDENCYTGIPGLYACGEVTGGVHGANRLAGNALAEAAVFGIQAGRKAANDDCKFVTLDAAELDQVLRDSGVLTKETHQFDQDNNKKDTQMINLSSMKKEVRTIMGRNVGLIRSDKGLQSSLKMLEEYLTTIKKYRAQSYEELIAQQQLKLMLITALLITESALSRKESLGAHFIQN